MEPLPPVKEVEYRCIIGKTFDELSGSEFITFAFETAKEFSSFRYEIAVRYRIQPGSLEFKVLGMTATRTMMPAFGTARSVLKIPLLPFGVYSLRLIKSDGTDNIFSLEVTKKGLQILQPIPRKRFIDLVIEHKAAIPGAKAISTVSKAPPVPLVPRTIQKRQPNPPTEEELAILESLKSETPEERDQREEMELFGGRKKVDKKELDAAEKDLKTMGDATPNHNGKKAAEDHSSHSTKKSGATKPQEEVKNVPADLKHTKAHVKEVAKPAAKPAAKPVKVEAKSAPSKNGKSVNGKAKPAAKPAPVAKAKAHAAPAKPAAKKPVAKAIMKPSKPVKKATKKH